MVIRPNYALDNAASHARKAERVKAIWPEVTVLPWGPDNRPLLRARDWFRIGPPTKKPPCSRP